MVARRRAAPQQGFQRGGRGRSQYHRRAHGAGDAGGDAPTKRRHGLCHRRGGSVNDGRTLRRPLPAATFAAGQAAGDEDAHYSDIRICRRPQRDPHDDQFGLYGGHAAPCRAAARLVLGDHSDRREGAARKLSSRYSLSIERTELERQVPAKHVRGVGPWQRRGLDDGALHGFIVSAYSARLAELYVDDLASGQLDDVEYGLRIALHVGRNNHIAPDLGLDAADVIGVRLGPRCVRCGLLLDLALTLGLRLQRLGLARLAVASLSKALFLQLLLCVLFFLFALALCLFLLKTLLLFLKSDVRLGLLGRRRLRGPDRRLG